MHSAYRFVVLAAASPQVLFEMPWNFALIPCYGAAQNYVIKSRGDKDRLSGFKSQLHRWLQDKAELLGRKGAGAWILPSWPSFSGLLEGYCGPLGVLESTVCKLLMCFTPLLPQSHNKGPAGRQSLGLLQPAEYLIQCVMSFPGAKWGSELSRLPVIIHLCTPHPSHGTVPVL